MTKGPLVTVAAVLATVLIIMSFAVVAFPDSVETIGMAAGVVALAAVVVLVLMLFIQVAARYAFQTGLAWTEEISRFSFIYFVYVSASLAVFRGTHIRVEVVVDRLPERPRRAVTLLGTVAQIAFFVTAGVAGTRLVLDMLAYPTLSPSLLLPLYYVYFIIPLSYFLMAVRLLQRSLSSGRESA